MKSNERSNRKVIKLKSCIYLKNDYYSYLIELVRKHKKIKLVESFHRSDISIKHLIYNERESCVEHYYNDKQYKSSFNASMFNVSELFLIIELIPVKYKENMIWI